jgi:MFS family permease
VKRFFSQPRLRLAWGLSLARAAWWSTFIIYTPIYAVDAGLGELAGGALVSVGVATVYSVGLWGKLGRRYGFRSLLIYGYSLSGVASIVVAILAGSAWAGAALLLLTAFVTASIDAAGNVPFLRAVRPLEREEMTGVFSTYRDASQLLPPAIFAVLLRFAPVYAVFGVAGLWMFASAWYSRFLPRRM